MSKCDHNNFTANVDVIQITDDEGNITSYQAEIEVTCADCYAPMQFLGLPAGANLENPTVSVDGTQLRQPIKPVEL